MYNLRIAIPSKGRQAEINEGLLKAAGLSFRRSERMLFARCKELPVEITFLRTDDIPVLCAEGAVDMALVGSDVVAEAQADVITRLEIGGGSWQISVCVPESSSIKSVKDLAGHRIATSFPNVTREYLLKHKVDAHLVNLSGSMEIMISLGVAEAIVDLVETGSTLAANQLRVLDEIGSYQTVLIQNRQKRHAELADRVVRRLKGVIVARGYSLLGIQRAPQQTQRGRKNHARLQLADDQFARRSRYVRRQSDGPPRRSHRHHGTPRSDRRLGHPRNANLQLPPVSSHERSHLAPGSARG